MAQLLFPVPPPPLRQSGVNLVRSSYTPPDSTNGRWRSGFSFLPLPNVPPWADDACLSRTTADVASGGPGYYPTPGHIDVIPPILRTSDKCSGLGSMAHDFLGRAAALLDTTWTTGLEYEFWTGSQAQRSGWNNPYLASSHAVDVTPAGVPSLVRAIEILEQAIAGGGANGGTQGMIHLRPEALALLMPNLRRDGAMIYTPNDTIVVPGNGYPNWGPASTVGSPSIPASGQTWLYATGVAMVLYDDIQLFPDPNLSDSEWRIEAMDRSTNSIVVRAERFAVATWDYQIHFACRASLDT